MNEQSVFQRLLNAQNALKYTVQKILDLNRQLKSLMKSKSEPEHLEIKKELKLLNKMADQQAKIVQLYETNLHQRVSN